MKTSKKFRKNIIITVSIIVLIGIINFIVSSVIKNKLTAVLLENESKDYTSSIEHVNFKLIQRSLTLENIILIPTRASVSELVNKKEEKESLENITLSSVSFNGIGIVKLLFSKNISINRVVFNDLFIRKISNSKKEEEVSVKTKKPINLDSIFIKKLGGLEIDNIEFNNLKFQEFDIGTNKVTFQNDPISFNSSGVKLVEISDEVFQLLPSKEIFKIEDIELSFAESNYNLSLRNLSIDFAQNVLNIQHFQFKPTISKFDLAQKYVYNDDVFDVALKELKVYNFSLDKAVKSGAIFLDSITIDGLDLKLFKDKRKPFNKNKYVGLPHLSLQNSNKKIHIPLVSVKNSQLLIEEQLENKDTLFSLSINDITAKVQNITSMSESIEAPITVNIDAKLMNKAPLKVAMSLPLKKGHETFYFSGELGKSEFELYDAALYPVLGLKILSGEIDKLQFNAKGNNTSSSGTMTMLYHNLEATVFKSNSLKRNKFLSWSVNNVIRKSNPNKRGKIKNVEMHFSRDTYKGLGNYIWKTLQSGIVNTISPTGKDTKKE